MTFEVGFISSFLGPGHSAARVPGFLSFLFKMSKREETPEAKLSGAQLTFLLNSASQTFSTSFGAETFRVFAFAFGLGSKRKRD